MKGLGRSWKCLENGAACLSCSGPPKASLEQAEREAVLCSAGRRGKGEGKERSEELLPPQLAVVERGKR